MQRKKLKPHLLFINYSDNSWSRSFLCT
jgi:hypothetical protein